MTSKRRAVASVSPIDGLGSNMMHWIFSFQSFTDEARQRCVSRRWKREGETNVQDGDRKRRFDDVTLAREVVDTYDDAAVRQALADYGAIHWSDIVSGTAMFRHLLFVVLLHTEAVRRGTFYEFLGADGHAVAHVVNRMTNAQLTEHLGADNLPSPLSRPRYAQLLHCCRGLQRGFPLWSRDYEQHLKFRAVRTVFEHPARVLFIRKWFPILKQTGAIETNQCNRSQITADESKLLSLLKPGSRTRVTVVTRTLQQSGVAGKTISSTLVTVVEALTGEGGYSRIFVSCSSCV